MWLASLRHLKLSHIDPHFTYKQYTEVQANLKRQQASMLMQIHTGHIPLNFYLHHIKKLETSNCTEHQGQGPIAKETIMHFLFKCEAYNREHHELDC